MKERQRDKTEKEGRMQRCPHSSSGSWLLQDSDNLPVPSGSQMLDQASWLYMLLCSSRLCMSSWLILQKEMQNYGFTYVGFQLRFNGKEKLGHAFIGMRTKGCFNLTEAECVI